MQTKMPRQSTIMAAPAAHVVSRINPEIHRNSLRQLKFGSPSFCMAAWFKTSRIRVTILLQPRRAKRGEEMIIAYMIISPPGHPGADDRFQTRNRGRYPPV